MLRRLLIPLLLSALFLAGCASDQTACKKSAQSAKCGSCSQETPVGSVQKVRTTAYTSSEPGGSRGANGKHLCCSNKKGVVKSAASDWSRFPIGTRFQIVSTGEVYEICDYGSALVGKKTIDLYKASRHDVRSWGVRYVEIKILAWGSPKKSLDILEPRHSRHVRAMVADLRSQT